MSKPVAIVTGAGSGIGLAVATHLLSLSYLVVLAELNPTTGAAAASSLGPSALFVQTDVSSYASLARLFARAYAWGGGRIDVFHANAGIDDRQMLYDSATQELDEEGLLKPLNTSSMRVDLEAVVQGLWLFRYYVGKSPGKRGKYIATSSAAGLYCMTQNPQYTASKYGVVGFVRASGPILVKEGITVNAICPAFIPTNLCPPEILPLWPKEHITPMTTALKAIDAILADDTMTGQTIELSQENLYFRKMADWANESQRWVGEESQSIWDLGYQKVPERPTFVP